MTAAEPPEHVESAEAGNSAVGSAASPEEPGTGHHNGRPPGKAPPPCPQSTLSLKCWYITWCATLGCLARIGSDKIFSDVVKVETPFPPFDPSFLSNTAGSFLLGALSSSALTEDTIPGLYTGLTTGFCGSFTTFSSWNLSKAKLVTDELSLEAQNDVATALLSMVVSVAFFAACFVAGSDLGPLASAGKRCGCCHRQSSAKAAVVPGIAGFVATYLSMIFLLLIDGLSSEERRGHWLAGLFAPFGALTRFFLGRWLNGRWRGGRFPWGTFAANLLGSIVLAVIIFLDIPPETGLGSSLFAGITTGFISSLTTMSTFAGEVVSLRVKHGLRHSYAYLAATLVCDQATASLIGAVS